MISSAWQGAFAELAPIEEVVVTGEFRDTTLERTAASVGVIAPGEQRDAVNHLEELLGRVANVNYASGASRARFVQIRGIGERGQFAEPFVSSVGTLIDGVDVSGMGAAAATLYDVAQVEVFRGPQGTLFGANALAGLINVVTNDPTDVFTARGRLDAGDYDYLGAAGVVSDRSASSSVIAWSYSTTRTMVSSTTGFSTAKLRTSAMRRRCAASWFGRGTPRG